MPVAPSFDDLLEQFVSEAQAQRADLAFANGDVSEAQAHGAGAMADVVLRYSAQSFKDTFYSTSKGDALTALVSDRTDGQVQREPATRAQVTLRFQRTGGGAGGTIDAGTMAATAIGADGVEIRFETDTPIVVAGGNNGPFTVTATCTIDGPSGNVAASTITRVLDSLWDSFTVTNPANAGGGNNEESDPALVLRAQAWRRSLRKGTLDAIESGARQVTSVRIAKATEDQDTGEVTLVVSDEDGNSTAQMLAAVTAEMERWRAAGVDIAVVGGTPLIVNVVATLDVDAGIDPAIVGPRAQLAIEARMRKQRQGEPLHLDSIKAAAISVDPDGINALIMTTPTDTITPAAWQVVRPGTVSIS